MEKELLKDILNDDEAQVLVQVGILFDVKGNANIPYLEEGVKKVIAAGDNELPGLCTIYVNGKEFTTKEAEQYPQVEDIKCELEEIFDDFSGCIDGLHLALGDDDEAVVSLQEIESRFSKLIKKLK